MSELDAAGRFISQVGFPIFVAVILLWQVRSMHQDAITVMRSLAEELARLRQVVESRWEAYRGK